MVDMASGMMAFGRGGFVLSLGFTEDGCETLCTKHIV